ncbi:hypothetical protein IE53DRAFT_316589 [Violaceomyces palustris]|uniref:Uncharacterized protein n=1 Tax=Violaceomyces palustris TaxID=1673888 RepID=A0ACD0NVW2_9BASI|nr:hypothetical protein IE53DRAFT_316589 [Violaceomyces palustris]
MPSNQRPLTGKTKYKKVGADSRVDLYGKVLFVFSLGFFLASVLFSLGSRSVTSNTSYSTATRKGSRCDPFEQPGFVQPPRSAQDIATWRNFDPSCQPSSLLSTLLTKLDPSRDASQPSNKRKPHSTTLAENELYSFLSNRTVLLIGDLVDRTLVKHFCTIVGHKAQAVDRNHPWGEALYNVPTKHIFPNTQSGTGYDGNAKPKIAESVALAHYCYLPEYDFLITSVYSYGADTSDFWHLQESYHPPSLYEHRISDLYFPYLKSLASKASTSPALPKPRQSVTPDLIFFNSGFWDLARWSQQDITNGNSAISDLTEERLLWWRSRMVDMLSATRKAWPASRIVWRDTHYPVASEASTVEWFLGQNDAQSRKNHPLFHTSRIAQINNARQATLSPHGDDVVKGKLSRSARMPKGVASAPIGSMTLGQDHHSIDPLNPGLNPTGAIFSEMMLWQLRAAVEGS